MNLTTSHLAPNLSHQSSLLLRLCYRFVPLTLIRFPFLSPFLFGFCIAYVWSSEMSVLSEWTGALLREGGGYEEQKKLDNSKTLSIVICTLFKTAVV
jgi:hypothetical protein